MSVPMRYWLWALAFALDFLRFASPDARNLFRSMPPDRDHAAERHAELTLIVLGEAFIKVLDDLSVLLQVRDAQPRTTACEECLAWVSPGSTFGCSSSCGHVGCCDGSKLRHATGHAAVTTHP